MFLTDFVAPCPKHNLMSSFHLTLSILWFVLIDFREHFVAKIIFSHLVDDFIQSSLHRVQQ